eukprot:TRINITY_DN2563_c0_g1_i14.p2 TRINITY_DN2563_c0_g1~~TRINITY_DN2563_c0_g1_i14.p2  ORF type:complete len:178 (+),score=81.06 TRINITY_DN2563_c0_g1_i14:46-534(+)
MLRSLVGSEMCIRDIFFFFFFFQAEDGIRDAQESRGLGDVYKRQGFCTVHVFSMFFSFSVFFLFVSRCVGCTLVLLYRVFMFFFEVLGTGKCTELLVPRGSYAAGSQQKVISQQKVFAAAAAQREAAAAQGETEIAEIHAAGVVLGEALPAKLVAVAATERS